MPPLIGALVTGIAMIAILGRFDPAFGAAFELAQPVLSPAPAAT